MKSICGISTRGMCYFGASVHICLGMVFFVIFLDRVLRQSEAKVDKEGVVYFGLFLPLGIIIFKAIDKENKTLLKWASSIFLALQLFGMVTRIKFGYMMLAPRGNYMGPGGAFTVVDYVKLLSLEIVSTIAYLVTLYLYTRQLECFPGTIYGQVGLPMYSRSSGFFPDSHHGGSHHHHRSGGMMTTPFTFNFEPPPPYSSTNNLAGTDDEEGCRGTGGTSSCRGTQQQPCSSRSVFHNIGRIGHISFKNKSSNSRHHNHHHHHNSSSSSSSHRRSSRQQNISPETQEELMLSTGSTGGSTNRNNPTSRCSANSNNSGRRSSREDSHALMNLKEIDG